jgi:hypothetical protein
LENPKWSTLAGAGEVERPSLACAGARWLARTATVVATAVTTTASATAMAKVSRSRLRR